MLILQILISAFVAFMIVSFFYNVRVRRDISKRFDNTYLNNPHFQKLSPSEQVEELKNLVRDIEHDIENSSGLKKERSWLLLREVNRRLSAI